MLDEIKKLLSKGISAEYIDELEALNGGNSLLSDLNMTKYDQMKSSFASNFVNDSKIDQKALKTVNNIKQLFGDKHPESRDMMNKLQLEVDQGRISINEDEFSKLAKRNKDAPVLDKSKLMAD